MPLPLIGLGAILTRFVAGAAVGTVLRTAGIWLMKGLAFTFLTQLGPILLLAVGEFIPRLLGLGQGLFSWITSMGVSATWYAISYAFDFVGLTLPSFSDLLSGMPEGVVEICSMMRVHKVIYILISIPIFNLMRSIVGHIQTSISASAGASALISRGVK